MVILYYIKFNSLRCFLNRNEYLNISNDDLNAIINRLNIAKKE